MKCAKTRPFPTRLRPLLLALAAGLCSGNAAAFKFETGNPDLDINWDNTVRYNAGWRIDKRERTLADTWSQQGGEYAFDKGDLVTNRVDLLSEFDLVFRRTYGFRVSGAAWYDAAYDDKVRGNPAFQAAGLGTAYPNNRFTSKVERYYRKSGELLDAFVFGRLDIGDSPLDARFGRHNIYWGESLFSPIHGVSYSQGPVDFRKALANPGSEAKELFLPLNQVSALWRLNETFSLGAQYMLEWKPYRLPEGGTYLSFADLVFSGGTNFFGIPFHGDLDHGPDGTPDDRGSWGVSAKATTGFGTFGAYYRRFDDRVPQVLSPGGTFASLHNAYAEDVKLYGLSLSKLVGQTAVSGELVRRENTVLNTNFGAAELARGDTLHALVNAIFYFGETPLFDSAVLMTEATWSRLDKLKAGTRGFYNECRGASVATGCSTRSGWGVSATFSPTWFQVLPSLDLTMPIHYDVGVNGNSPVPFGGNEDSGSWSIGLSADYQARYKIDLTYTDYLGDYTKRANDFAGVPGIGPMQMAASSGNGVIRDRGWVSLTFKTSF